MYGLAERIALLQHDDKFVRKRADGCDLRGQTPVGDEVGQRRALIEKRRGAPGKVVQACEQRRGRLLRAECLDRDVALGESVERNIDAVEIAIVGAAVLQMVD